MFSSFRIACRSLAKTPGFTAAAILTLAICLGANLAIYSVVDAVLVRDLPFPKAGELVTLFNSYPKAGSNRSSASIPNYFERRHALPAFASLSLYQEATAIVGDTGSPRRAPILRVSPEFFATLGVPLAMGRTFTDDELTYENGQVAILTDRFWRKYFDAAPDVIGRTFLNDGGAVTVVGVLPPNFKFLSGTAEFIRPLSHDLRQRRPESRHSNSYDMIGRLATGTSLTVAQAQVDALNAKLLEDDPIAEFVRNSGFSTIVRPLHQDYVRNSKQTLLLLQAGVAGLLGIGLFNLANLLLVRASGRQHDLAVRQALGAGRHHIVAEVLLETSLLTLAGGVLGCLLGSIGTDLFRAFGTNLLPPGTVVALDARIVAIGLVGALVSGLFIAAPVIWFNLRPRISEALQSGSRYGTPGPAAQRLRHAFIVVQITLAFGLITGAGLLGHSLAHALNAPSGFRADGVLSGQISLPWLKYKDAAAQLEFAERLVPALRQLPGVTQAAISTGIPFSQTVDTVMSVEGQPPRAGEALNTHYMSSVTPDYWATLQVPLVRGRFLTSADSHSENRVCVVDTAFAERYWHGEDPIGRHIAEDISVTSENAFTIVGVVGEVRQNNLTEKAGHGAVYFPHRGYPGFSILLRSELPPEALAPAVRKVVLSLDPSLPVDDLRPMDDRIAATLVGRRAPTLLATLLAGVALLLCGLGTYGSVSYAVSQREREIGVRTALGAQPSEILQQFFKQGLRLLGVGLALGLICAWSVGHALQALLYSVPSLHVPTLLIACVTMVCTVLIACWLPARRATRIDPIIALRAD
jgi:predicted permease